ncbi:transporter [Sulfurovum lithotrophicum]|uniref:Transporter n=2 Tax=Sulfurovum lithotrophicum TaxID=206403 RepID=A0A7U4RRQ4_9BACT|nr:transporter [Sulfurovum lithotrophicum]
MKRVILLLSLSLPLVAGVKNLPLREALDMVKHDNLEVKVARFNEQMQAMEVKVAEGMNYGSLDVTLSGMRSNDALNVFGFKLMDREATFGDFGFSQFLEPIGNALMAANNGQLTPQMLQGMSSILEIQPHDLNYPGARNNYQTKLSYMLPIYTGGKLTEYKHIMESMYRMSKYDTQKLLNVKIYEVKKAFYDISLVERYITNLSKIRKNINTLEDVIRNMQKEGYAKEMDLLEVQARKAEADSMYNQAKLNRDLAYQFLSFLLNRDISSIHKVSARAPMPHVDKHTLELNNIDIQKAKLGLQISEMAVKVEKSSFLPTVGGFAEYGSADNTLFNDFTGKDSYTFGVQAKWNIFNGGQDDARLEKAKLKRLQVRDQVELAKKGIVLKAKKLKTEILSADADIKSYKKQLQFAKRVYENYRTRYEEGLASITDVLIQQSKQLESLLKLLTVVNKRNTKIFELESIINKGGDV